MQESEIRLLQYSQVSREDEVRNGAHVVGKEWAIYQSLIRAWGRGKTKVLPHGFQGSWFRNPEGCEVWSRISTSKHRFSRRLLHFYCIIVTYLCLLLLKSEETSSDLIRRASHFQEHCDEALWDQGPAVPGAWCLVRETAAQMRRKMRYGAMDSNAVKQSCCHEFPHLRLTAFPVTLTTAKWLLSSYISFEDEGQSFYYLSTVSWGWHSGLIPVSFQFTRQRIAAVSADIYSSPQRSQVQGSNPA